MKPTPFIAAAALSLVGLACAATPPPGKNWVIGMSQCSLGEPWRVQMNADLRKAAAAHPEFTVGFKDAPNGTRGLLRGGKVPKKLTLASRVCTRENLARGGEILR
jgi:ABC-type sugar transport system substrate-binding protein